MPSSLLPPEVPLALLGDSLLPGNLRLADPAWLAALLCLPLLLWWRRRQPLTVWLLPGAAAWHRSRRVSATPWPALAALGGLLLLIVALARPQRIDDRRETQVQGYDLMLAIDLSTSMLAEDYERRGERINRLQAIKPVIQAFVRERPNDRIGIVVFAGRAYTLAPLTFDHAWLQKQLERLSIGLIEDGTAIGDGLGVALSRLEQAKRDLGGRRLGAFVVLLTDGVNNRGAMNPEQALALARSRHIPIFTIGAGKRGWVPMPVGRRADGSFIYERQYSDIDEDLLQVMAQETEGQFFRAEDTGTVEEAFAAIDRAKKIEFDAKSRLLTTELFPWLAAPGALLFLLGALACHRWSPTSPPTKAPTP